MKDGELAVLRKIIFYSRAAKRIVIKKPIKTHDNME
jgi:hypothetical protein